MWITDLYTEKAVERIQNHNSSVPLFLYLAFQAPHSPIPRPPDKYMSEYKGFRSVYQAGLPNGSQAIHRAAAVTAMDIGVGKVVEIIEMLTNFFLRSSSLFKVVDALKAAGIYENSVIVFTTDNGGAADKSSNFPFRDRKESLYEGGVRGVGWVHSPLLCRSGYENNRMMFISDWFNTLLSIAGLESLLPASLDSINMWSSISRNSGSSREEIIFNLDQDNYWRTWSAAIRVGRFKLIWGQPKLLKLRVRAKLTNRQLQLFNFFSI